MRHLYTTLDVPSVPCLDGGNSLHLLLTGPGGGGCCMSCMLSLIVDPNSTPLDASRLLEHLVELLNCEPSLLCESGENIHEWMISLVLAFRSARNSSSVHEAAGHHHDHRASALDSFLALALAMDAPFVLQALHDVFSNPMESDDTKLTLALFVSDLLAPPAITSEQTVPSDGGIDDTSRGVMMMLSDQRTCATEAHELFLRALLGGANQQQQHSHEGSQLTFLIIQQTSMLLSSHTLLLSSSQGELDDRKRTNAEATRRSLVALMCYVSLQLLQLDANLVASAGIGVDVTQALVNGCAQSAKRFHMAPCDITPNALALLSATLDIAASTPSVVTRGGSSVVFPPQVRLHGRGRSQLVNAAPTNNAAAHQTQNPFMSFMSGHPEDSLSGTMRDESQQHLPYDDSTSDDDEGSDDLRQQQQQRIAQMFQEVLTCLMPLMLSTSEVITATASSILGRVLATDLLPPDSFVHMSERLFEHACEALRTRNSRNNGCVPIFELASQTYRECHASSHHNHNHYRAPTHRVNALLALHLLEIMDSNAAYFTDTVVVSELFHAAIAECDIHDLTQRVLHLVKCSGMTLHSMVVLLHVVLLQHPRATTLSSTMVQLLAHNTRSLILDPLLRPTHSGGDEHASVPSPPEGDRLSTLSIWLQVRVCEIVVKLTEMTSTVHDWCVRIYHHLRVATRSSDTPSGQPEVLLGSTFFPMMLKAASLVAAEALRGFEVSIGSGAALDASSSSHGVLLDDIADVCVQVMATCGVSGAAFLESQQLLESIIVHSVRTPFVVVSPLQLCKNILSAGRQMFPRSFRSLVDALLCSAIVSDVITGVHIAFARLRIASSQEASLPSPDAVVTALRTLYNALRCDMEEMLQDDVFLWSHYLLFLCDHSLVTGAPSLLSQFVQDTVATNSVTRCDATEVHGQCRVSLTGVEQLWSFVVECGSTGLQDPTHTNNRVAERGIEILLSFLEHLGHGALQLLLLCGSRHDNGSSTDEVHSITLSHLFGATAVHLLHIKGDCIGFLTSMCQRLVHAVSKRVEEEFGIPASEAVAALLHCICRCAFTPALNFDESPEHCVTVGDSVLTFLAGCQETMPVTVSRFLAQNYLGPLFMAATRADVITVSNIHRVNTIARLVLPCLTLTTSAGSERSAAAAAASCIPYLRVFSRWALDVFEYHYDGQRWGYGDAECPVARVLSACLELQCGGDVASRIVKRLVSSPHSSQHTLDTSMISFDCLQLRLSAFRTLRCSASAALVEHVTTLPAVLQLLALSNQAKKDTSSRAYLVALEKISGLCCSFFDMFTAETQVRSEELSPHLNVMLWIGFAVDVFLRACMVAPSSAFPSPSSLLLCAMVLRQFSGAVHFPVVLALVLQLLKTIASAQQQTIPLDPVTTAALQIILQSLTKAQPMWAEMSAVGASAIEQLSRQCDALCISGLNHNARTAVVLPTKTSSHGILQLHRGVDDARRPTFCAATCGVSLDFFVCLFL